MATVQEWIEAYAQACGRPAPDSATVDAILALAGTAAHASARQAAPVTCWLAAVAGLTPEEADEVAHRVAGLLGGDEADGPATS